MVLTNVQLGQFEPRLKLFFKLERLYIAYVYNKRHYKIGHISLLLKVPLFVIHSKLNVYFLLCNHFIILIIPDVLLILLFMFQVAHSMRIHDQPLEPWLIVSDDGSEQSASCTCMAGGMQPHRRCAVCHGKRLDNHQRGICDRCTCVLAVSNTCKVCVTVPTDP